MIEGYGIKDKKEWKGEEVERVMYHVVSVTVGDGGRYKVSLVSTQYNGRDLPCDRVRACTTCTMLVSRTLKKKRK